MRKLWFNKKGKTIVPSTDITILFLVDENISDENWERTKKAFRDFNSNNQVLLFKRMKILYRKDVWDVVE